MNNKQESFINDLDREQHRSSEKIVGKTPTDLTRKGFVRAAEFALSKMNRRYAEDINFDGWICEIIEKLANTHGLIYELSGRDSIDGRRHSLEFRESEIEWQAYDA